MKVVYLLDKKVALSGVRNDILYFAIERQNICF